MPPARRTPVPPTGLAGLRRRGAITEILFLYECITREPPQLRPIAESLGLTVQAASHIFRQLARRGLAELREGRYRSTVKGVAWLHEALGELTEDVRERSGRLHVIRSTRAIARHPLSIGAPVSLELDEGLLYARRGGSGESHGKTAHAARRGELVQVVDLEGIVPLARGPIRVVTFAPDDLTDPTLPRRLARILRAEGMGLLGAPGLEAYHLARQATDEPIVRFAVAAQAHEASRLGVRSTVVLLDRELPRFLSNFVEPDPPPMSMVALGHRGRRGGSSRAA
jgi:predicted transcriptional regulator